MLPQADVEGVGVGIVPRQRQIQCSMQQSHEEHRQSRLNTVAVDKVAHDQQVVHQSGWHCSDELSIRAAEHSAERPHRQRHRGDPQGARAQGLREGNRHATPEPRQAQHQADHPIARQEHATPNDLGRAGGIRVASRAGQKHRNSQHAASDRQDHTMRRRWQRRAHLRAHPRVQEAETCERQRRQDEARCPRQVPNLPPS
mmetsp:Transcript_70487/g.229205  ORF Transcript_70487/g.229205 Transcript_70487/m.229205 type:complete len:200 (+) Transcript_70487:299-898(+)